MAKRGIPPWHMWGSTSAVKVPCSLLSIAQNAPTVVTQQLLQVNYGRPESWNFLCEAKLLECSIPNPQASNVSAFFELQLGLGRSTVIFPQFMQFQWNIATDIGVQRYATSAPGPVRFAGDLTPNIIENFTAQAIQARCNVVWAQGFDVGATATVEITMHVSPIVHTRPEWHSHREDAQYPGGENEGH
jgi:hypothetical protein